MVPNLINKRKSLEFIKFYYEKSFVSVDSEKVSVSRFFSNVNRISNKLPKEKNQSAFLGDHSNFRTYGKKHDNKNVFVRIVQDGFEDCDSFNFENFE